MAVPDAPAPDDEPVVDDVLDGTPDDPGEADHQAEADDADVVDVLPDDLDVSGYVGPYVFPNNNRRRVPGYLYLAMGVACIVAWATRSGGAVLINEGFLFAGIGLVLVGCYHLLSGWNLDVDEQDALVISTRTVGFAVGHASAQMGWRGLRSRPTWRILLYSADNPPTTRGLVLVDGVDGEVVDWFTEDNPEDWSDLDGAITAGRRKPT